MRHNVTCEVFITLVLTSVPAYFNGICSKKTSKELPSRNLMTSLQRKHGLMMIDTGTLKQHSLACGDNPCRTILHVLLSKYMCGNFPSTRAQVERHGAPITGPPSRGRGADGGVVFDQRPTSQRRVPLDVY